MGKSHDLATLKDDGGTFKSSLVIDTGTNGTPTLTLNMLIPLRISLDCKRERQP